ncbi:unnamed protein product [Allacma fusca]|uniref:Uncharacterized protein n=1 Tax=Allacma fusca TaxID=39272 RepID=A0A8J2L7G9_9HEXA|nr:unnamed protein product [Allacma fusca]
MKIVIVRSRVKIVITVVVRLLIFTVFTFNVLICWEACKVTKTIIQAPKFRAKEACIIPKTPDMPEYFRKGWRPTKSKFNCSYERRLTSIENEKDLRLLGDWGKVNASCCLQEVLRMRRDTRYM